MGQCISNQNSTRRGGEHVERYNAEPNDTATLSPNDFPKLEFNTLLTKLKLKRCNFYVIHSLASGSWAFVSSSQGSKS